MTPSLNRRHFLALGATALATRSLRSEDPADNVTIGIMGLRVRGLQLARHFLQVPGVTIAYLCDVDDAVVAPTLKVIESAGQKPPKVVKDFRQILDDPAVDGLVVAAPDHWHAMAAIHACQAGKHVYVEKPVSHNIVEGRRMIQAARRYDRIVQAGTQRRSNPAMQEMGAFLREGKIGTIHFVRAWITSRREDIGHAKDAPVPAGVDYDLWLGAAPMRAFNPNHFHYQWHWNWLYGTGELGNNGIHGLDLTRMALDLGAPTSIVASGGKHFFQDDQITPDTQIVGYEYPRMTLVWEHRTWSPRGMEGQDFGVEFHGEDGYVITDGVTWSHARTGEKLAVGGKSPSEPAHQQNWVDAIRGKAKPNADIEIGHGSTSLCHLGNISYRVGRKLTWNTERELFLNDPDADLLLGREYRSPWTLPEVS